MLASTDRIRTTHAGSLPRPAALVASLEAVSRHRAHDEQTLTALVDRSVAEVMARQLAVGIDIGNDGEQSRESFFTYVQHRMTGFTEGDGRARRWRDMTDFPDFIAAKRAQRSTAPHVSLSRPPQATGAVAYGSTDALEADLRRLEGHPFAEAFVTSASPGIVVAAMANRFYPSDDDYLHAVGRALAVEYRRIVEAGYVLQIDAPDLAMECHGLFGDRPIDEFLTFVEDVIVTINTALSDLPADRVRLHVCWGNYNGPHTRDVPLSALLPLLYEARVGGLVVSGGNPRHEHEYREFSRHPLPEGWILAAGVIDTTTNYVEHPEVVADRLERVAAAVGDPQRILACTDCGFDTAAGFGDVVPDVAWAKLETLSRGAALATTRLF